MIWRITRTAGNRTANVMSRSRRVMGIKSFRTLVTLIGTAFLAIAAPAFAADGVSPGRAASDLSRATPEPMDGLSTMPGEVIESPPPPPAEMIEYYAVDAIRSIRVVFAPDGNVIGRADYLPYGEEYSANNTPAERFTGQQRDVEAGLDYFGARSYQVRTGRFGSVDPDASGAAMEPQRWNRYAYALNNPLRYTDQTGMNANACAGDTHDACVTGRAPKIDTGQPEFEPVDQLMRFMLSMNLDLLSMGHGGAGGGVEPAGEPGFPIACGGPLQPRCIKTKTDEVLANLEIVGAALPIGALEVGGEAAATIAEEGTKLLNPAIEATEKGLQHVLDRHVLNSIPKFANKSKFDAAVDLIQLLREGTQMPMMLQRNGNFARIFKAGRVIGIDRATGQATDTLTIITNPAGQLVTMFPGVP